MLQNFMQWALLLLPDIESQQSLNLTATPSAPLVHSTSHLFKRQNACANAFGSAFRTNTCNPSDTLCCVRPGAPFPQCLSALNRGWCCIGDGSCYIDEPSSCGESGAVTCPDSTLGQGVDRACCPRLTTCATNFNQTVKQVRCNIAQSALTSAASTSSAAAPSSTTSGTGGPTAPGSSSTASPLAGSSTPEPNPSGISGGVIAAIVLGALLGLALIGALFFVIRHKRAKKVGTPAPQYQQPAQYPYTADPKYAQSPQHHPPMHELNSEQNRPHELIGSSPQTHPK